MTALHKHFHCSLSYCCKLRLSCRHCSVSWLIDCCKLHLSCRHCSFSWLSHCCKLRLSCRHCSVSWLSDCHKLCLSCRPCWSVKQLRSAAACMLPHALHAVLCMACWAQQAQQPPILTPLPSSISSTTPSQVTHLLHV